MNDRESVLDYSSLNPVTIIPDKLKVFILYKSRERFVRYWYDTGSIEVFA